MALVLIISGCGEGTKKVTTAPLTTQGNASMQQSAQAASEVKESGAKSEIPPIAEILKGGRGSYLCTLTKDGGTMTMKTKNNKIRFEMQTAQGTYTSIMETSETMFTNYIKIPNQQRWMKMTYQKGAEQAAAHQKTPGVITEQDVKTYPKVDCKKADIPDSEFVVPQDQVMEMPSMPAQGMIPNMPTQ